MGILSKLIDPNAVPTDLGSEHEFGSIEDLGHAGSSLKPSASETEALQQIVVPAATEQRETDAARHDEAPTAASIDEVAVDTADSASTEGISDDDTDSQSFELVESESPEGRLLSQLLKTHRWNDPESDDPDVRALAVAQQFFMRRVIASGCSRGLEGELQHVWNSHAPPDAPSFEDIQQRRRASVRPAVLDVIPHAMPYAAPHEFTALAVRPPSDFAPVPPVEFPQRPASQVPAAAPSHRAALAQPSPSQQPGGGGSGFGLGELVKAPFTMLGAAGSLVLAGLNRAGSVAQATYVRSRVNGHSVLASQLDGHSQAVVDLSHKLRTQGMGDLVDAIKRTGAPASEVFDGMREGGKYDVLGKRFDRLMKQPEIAATYAELQSQIHQFDSVAKRYAKTGIDLNLDHDTPIRMGGEAMLRATEGIPVKEGGAFKQLTESLREMTEKIAQMIQRLFSRFSPA